MRKIRKKAANWDYNFLKKEEEIFLYLIIGKNLSQSVWNWSKIFILILSQSVWNWSKIFSLNFVPIQ